MCEVEKFWKKNIDHLKDIYDCMGIPLYIMYCHLILIDFKASRPFGGILTKTPHTQQRLYKEDTKLHSFKQSN